MARSRRRPRPISTAVDIAADPDQVWSVAGTRLTGRRDLASFTLATTLFGPAIGGAEGHDEELERGLARRWVASGMSWRRAGGPGRQRVRLRKPAAAQR